jgi:hypothetical protein
MSQLNCKQITIDNWLIRDDAIFMNEKAWFGNVLLPVLNNSVPPDILSLFEVARYSMLYGYFYYPLITLSSEQLFRVVDTAVSHKYSILNCCPQKTTFDNKIKVLIKNKIITFEQVQHYGAIRYFRNSSSHPKEQKIFNPAMAFTILDGVVEMINKLYE